MSHTFPTPTKMLTATQVVEPRPWEKSWDTRPKSPPIITTHDPRTVLKRTEIEDFGFGYSRRKQRRIQDQPISYPEDYISKEQAEENQARLDAFFRQQAELAEARRVQEASAKALIAQVAAKAAEEEAAAAAAALQAKKLAEEAAEKAERKKQRAALKKTMTPEEKERNKEKRLMKLVGAVVVKCMSKYSKQFDRDVFKQHAKEVRNFFYAELHDYFRTLIPALP